MSHIDFKAAVSDTEPGTMVWTMTHASGITLWAKRQGAELDTWMVEQLRLYVIAKADTLPPEAREQVLNLMAAAEPNPA
jgi:hypothetical protein